MLSQHFSQQRKQESGFTLVELLVVIVIIGLLAAIAVPIFMNQRQKANDTLLTSDLRNAAIAYETWYGSKDGSNEAFREISGTSAMVVYHPGVELENTSVRWNEQEGLPTVTVSEGTRIEITNNDRHLEGDYCLVGANPNSSYDYLQGSGDAANYDKYLYYDPQLGGISDMDDLAAAFPDDSDENPAEYLSCFAYADRYLDQGDA